MIKTTKRTKRSRYRGTHTHGGGAKKRGRGSGHRGGVGNAGSGKRADHKKNLSLDAKRKFGVDKRIGKRIVKNIEVVDLRRVIGGLDSFVKKGLVKTNKDGYEMDFSGKKVLCTGEIKDKLMIKAKQASKSAVKKVKKAGGNIELGKKLLKNKGKKEDKKEE